MNTNPAGSESGTPAQTLLVTCDALRADHLGQFGYRRETMPALDRIADEGTTYTRAFANGAHTQLSVPSFLTGRHDGLTAIRDGPTIATELADDGVTTMGVHSNAVVRRDFPHVAGFEEFEDLSEAAEGDSSQSASLADRLGETVARTTSDLLERLRPYLGDYEWAVRLRRAVVPDVVVHEPTPYADAELVTDTVLEWVDDHADEPFFAWVHYMDPHRPYGVSLEDPAYVDEAPSYDEINELMATAGVSPERVTPSERAYIVDLYDSDLRYLSTQLDRLFDGLAERGVWEDATVLLTGDHGEEFGDHGQYYHRNKPYDELVHVPLFMRGPGVPEAAVDEQRSLVDILPTVLSRHGVDVPESADGRPLTDPGERTVLSAALRGELWIGVRADGWKYITDGDDAAELFDLGADPDEQTSVLEDHPETAERLRRAIPEALFELEASVDSLGEPTEPGAETRERLADLGYLE